jgi:hypothetical protein
MAVAERAMLNELYFEDVELPFDPAGEAPSTPGDDWTLVTVRNMLVRMRQLEREVVQAKEAKAAIVDSYDHQIAGKQAQVDTLRGSLQGILERGPFGPRLQFADAGKIHLSTAGGNVVLANQEAAVSEYGFRFEKSVTDITAMTAWARQHVAAGNAPPTGFEVAPKRKTLVVSKP